MLKILHFTTESLTMINITTNKRIIEIYLAFSPAQSSVYFIPVNPSSLAFPKSLSARTLFFK